MLFVYCIGAALKSSCRILESPPTAELEPLTHAGEISQTDEVNYISNNMVAHSMAHSILILSVSSWAFYSADLLCQRCHEPAYTPNVYSSRYIYFAAHIIIENLI